MKYIKILLLSLLLLSCKDEITQQPSNKTVPEIVHINLYKKHEVVYVGRELFQVTDTPNEYQEYYVLDKIDCRAGDWQACRYNILESDITKQPHD
jgi:hypothetical protein